MESLNFKLRVSHQPQHNQHTNFSSERQNTIFLLVCLDKNAKKTPHISRSAFVFMFSGEI